MAPSCLITNEDFDTLKEQVRLGQEAMTDLQRRQEEQAMQMEGLENSIQMLEVRMDENTERIDDVDARISSPAVSDREFILPAPVQEEPLPGWEIEEPSAVEEPFPVELPAEEEPVVTYAPRTYGSSSDLYQSAYDHFEGGDFGQSILEFEEFVANYGDTDLADNAQYWIGECYYAQKDYRQAIREFDKVERNFSHGNKVPAAKIKKGYAYREMRNPSEARRELREVVERYPATDEALLAAQKLKAWE